MVIKHNEWRELVREISNLDHKLSRKVFRLFSRIENGENIEKREIEDGNCYCCTCGYSIDYNRIDQWDPACMNHGAHGKRGCKKHNIPAENCDSRCGCDYKVIEENNDST